MGSLGGQGPQKGVEGSEIWTPLFFNSWTPNQPNKAKTTFSTKILREYMSYHKVYSM